LSRSLGYSRYPADRPDRLHDDRQALLDLGCDPRLIFIDDDLSERGSGPALAEALAAIQAGDRLFPWAFKKGALQAHDMLSLAAELASRSASLVLPSLGVDTATPVGLALLRDLAEASSALKAARIARVKEGVAEAKAAGLYRGRVPTAQRQSAEVHALRAQGWSAIRIAKHLNISRASVYRILDGANTEPKSE
jgi:DNA invertase Pin-like site-specific DNA recombinase